MKKTVVIDKKNTNTNNLLLCVYTTHHHKTHTKYFYNNAPIDEGAYYAGINEKKRASVATDVMTIKLNEVQSLGGVNYEG